IEKNAEKALPEDRQDSALAQCYELLGFLKKAADRHEAAVQKQPLSVVAHRAAADFEMRVGRFSKAEALYRKIVEKQVITSDDDITAARRGLAVALVKQGHPQKMAQALHFVGLTLDEKGLVPDAKIAEAIDEQLVQAKVLGSLNHHRLRGKAITLLE